jgi:hypothetical protein
MSAFSNTHFFTPFSSSSKYTPKVYLICNPMQEPWLAAWGYMNPAETTPRREFEQRPDQNRGGSDRIRMREFWAQIIKLRLRSTLKHTIANTGVLVLAELHRGIAEVRRELTSDLSRPWITKLLDSEKFYCCPSLFCKNCNGVCITGRASAFLKSFLLRVITWVQPASSAV